MSKKHMQEMQQERVGAIQAARGMLDKAEGEKRSLTAEEDGLYSASHPMLSLRLSLRGT